MSSKVKFSKPQRGVQGVIEAYTDHLRVGALVELGCETDFVARTDEMRKLAKEVAMHIAATDPTTPGSMEETSRDKQVLLNQTYFRDARKTVRDILNETINTVGEQVWIERFIRWETPQFSHE